MPSRRTNNFPESGRGLGHVTLTIFGIRSNISLKLLELETSNLTHGFVLGMPSRRTNKFSWKWAKRGVGHVTPTNFGSTVGYPSDSLASCSFPHNPAMGYVDAVRCICNRWLMWVSTRLWRDKGTRLALSGRWGFISAEIRQYITQVKGAILCHNGTVGYSGRSHECAVAIAMLSLYDIASICNA